MRPNALNSNLCDLHYDRTKLTPRVCGFQLRNSLNQCPQKTQENERNFQKSRLCSCVFCGHLTQKWQAPCCGKRDFYVAAFSRSPLFARNFDAPFAHAISGWRYRARRGFMCRNVVRGCFARNNFFIFCGSPIKIEAGLRLRNQFHNLGKSHFVFLFGFHKK